VYLKQGGLLLKLLAIPASLNLPAFPLSAQLAHNVYSGASAHLHTVSVLIPIVTAYGSAALQRQGAAHHCTARLRHSPQMRSMARSKLAHAIVAQRERAAAHHSTSALSCSPAPTRAPLRRLPRARTRPRSSRSRSRAGTADSAGRRRAQRSGAPTRPTRSPPHAGMSEPAVAGTAGGYSVECTEQAAGVRPGDYQ
jgi:hypothetical protein